MKFSDGLVVGLASACVFISVIAHDWPVAVWSGAYVLRVIMVPR